MAVSPSRFSIHATPEFCPSQSTTTTSLSPSSSKSAIQLRDDIRGVPRATDYLAQQPLPQARLRQVHHQNCHLGLREDGRPYFTMKLVQGRTLREVLHALALKRREIHEMTTNLVDGDLPAAVLDLVADRSDGIPFFVEELIRNLIENELLIKKSDRWEVGAQAIPPQRAPGVRPATTG